MRRTLSVFLALLMIPIVCATLLRAGTARKVYPEVNLVGNEPPPVTVDVGGGYRIPSPPRIMEVGTVVDSTVMDHQCNGTIHQRIATVGDSALHVTAMVSYDPGFVTRGMRYVYYYNNLFTNFGYVEGSGNGDQRAGYGMITGYYDETSGLGNIAVTFTHVNLASRAVGMHWYSFQDAFQGVGAFSPTEGWYGNDSGVCDAMLWPSGYITNDPIGNMFMCGFTNSGSCAGGFDDIKVTTKTFFDTQWNDPTLLNTLDDVSQWTSGPNIPSAAGADNGKCGVVTTDFGTNVYYWESTDYGATWGDRQNITGYPTGPQNIPPDTTSQEYRPLQNGALAFSPDGTPHAVWTSYQAQGDNTPPGDSTYTPGTDGVWAYRPKLEHWDPIHGVNTVFQQTRGTRPDFGGFYPAAGTAFSYNVGHPAIGFDETGQVIYVVYEGFDENDQDLSNGLFFGDIYVSVSADGGATWQDRVNVTNSIGSDDLYPSIARINPQGVVQELPGFTVGNADGVNDFVMIYQNDDVAGTFMRGDETSPNFDRLLVAPVDFATISVTGTGDEGPGTGVDLPKAFALGQNYPNPFNPSTSISYQLAERADVRLTIHNIRGQVVRELVHGVQEAGTHSVQWNGRDASGETVASGIYLYVLETDKNFRSTRKMVVLK